jgi:hypothetical protein
MERYRGSSTQSGLARLSALITRENLGMLWNPAVLLFCQVLWLAVFLVTGHSMVTGSKLSFFVRADRI